YTTPSPAWMEVQIEVLLPAGIHTQFKGNECGVWRSQRPDPEVFPAAQPIPTPLTNWEACIMLCGNLA
ncbi:hypothetical protein ACFLXE_07255, partial [Chloroflexota bacterium]